MHHRHKKKHHDPKQQAGPAHLNFCGNAQGSGEQRTADEIRPKQTPWHVRGHAEHDESCAREMLRAEDRQWDGETQIAQGYDLLEAAGARDIGLRSPQRNKEKQDAGAAQRNHRARDLQKCGENGCVHVDAKRKLTRSIRGAFCRVNTVANCTTKSWPPCHRSMIRGVPRLLGESCSSCQNSLESSQLSGELIPWSEARTARITFPLCFKPTRRDTRRRSAQLHQFPQPLCWSNRSDSTHSEHARRSRVPFQNVQRED